MTWHVHAQGWRVNVKRVRPIYQAPRSSRPVPGHMIYPYRLQWMSITRAQQVWCADLTYVPLAKGFLDLVAIMDWWSRKVVAWHLSNTMDVTCCLEALDEALQRHQPPRIFNTDQGAHFRAEVWASRLQAAGIQISMDGKGRFRDIIFIERLWHSWKHECVYIHARDDGREARQGIRGCMEFDHQHRPHSLHARGTPDGA